MIESGGNDDEYCDWGGDECAGHQCGGVRGPWRGAGRVDLYMVDPAGRGSGIHRGAVVQEHDREKVTRQPEKKKCENHDQ